MGRKIWTPEEVKLLEKLYSEHKSQKEMAEILDRSTGSIGSKCLELKLGDKYMRSNHPKFKAIYQDYDWCYERYINKGMTYDEMAQEAGCKKRVIEKWCGERHQLHQWSFEFKETK